MRREFLQQAKTYKNQNPAGWYVSEKLDGTRCFWDGGVTRGVPTESVPWANITHPKTGRRRIKSTLFPLDSGAGTATLLWLQIGG